MPTFPQHRNMKKTAPTKETREPETNVTDQTNNLPAISDLVSLVYECLIIPSQIIRVLKMNDFSF